MAPTPTQLAWRARVETGLRFAAPLFDLVLATGDRLSRVLVPTDESHVPARPVPAIPESRSASEASRR